MSQTLRLWFPKNPFWEGEGQRSVIRRNTSNIIPIKTFTNSFFRYRDHAKCHEKLQLGRFTWRRHFRRASDNMDALLRPRRSLHLAAFDVLTLNEIGQQIVLPRTLENFEIDVCYLRNAHTESHSRDHALQPKMQPLYSVPLFKCPVTRFRALLVILMLRSF